MTSKRYCPFLLAYAPTTVSGKLAVLIDAAGNWTVADWSNIHYYLVEYGGTSPSTNINTVFNTNNLHYCILITNIC